MCTGAWRVSARASRMRRWQWTHGCDTRTVGTGRTDVTHGPLALDVRDVAKSVKPRGQGLIGLIGYSYQQVATSFLEAGLQRTPRLSVLGLEKFGDG